MGGWDLVEREEATEPVKMDAVEGYVSIHSIHLLITSPWHAFGLHQHINTSRSPLRTISLKRSSSFLTSPPLLYSIHNHFRYFSMTSFRVALKGGAAVGEEETGGRARKAKEGGTRGTPRDKPLPGTAWGLQKV